MLPNTIINNEIPNNLPILAWKIGSIGCRGVKDLIAG